MSWNQLSSLGGTVVVMVFQISQPYNTCSKFILDQHSLKVLYIKKKHKVARYLLKVLNVYIFVDNCYGGDLKYSTWCYPRCERS